MLAVVVASIYSIRDNIRGGVNKMQERIKLIGCLGTDGEVVPEDASQIAVQETGSAAANEEDQDDEDDAGGWEDEIGAVVVRPVCYAPPVKYLYGEHLQFSTRFSPKM